MSAGCGARHLDSGTGDGQTTATEPVIAVGWALEETAGRSSQSAVTTRVSLSLTDETGATEVEYMGEFTGRCHEPSTGSGAQGQVILVLSCSHPGGGTELRIRRYGAALILLRAPTGQGPAGLSFEEAGRVTIPNGASVRAKR